MPAKTEFETYKYEPKEGFKHGRGYVKPPIQPFKPHRFETKVEMGSTPCPVVFITPKVLNDMLILTDECDIEIGWLGTVEEIGPDLLITEIFVPKQTCGMAMTELSIQGLTEVSQELMSRPDGIKLVNKMRFWGHSHIDMDTHPSHQDDIQIDLPRRNKCKYFIRGIVNKRSKMQFTVYYFDKDITVYDAPWSVYYQLDDMTDRVKWQQQITDKITRDTTIYTGFQRAGRKGKKFWKSLWSQEDF